MNNEGHLAYPTISVLIPAFNEETLLGATLDSIRQSFAVLGRLDYEIIVCDNNSTDATAEIARAQGASVVFEVHNQIAKARNAAARVARGEWLIFLDADTQLNPGLLRETIARFESGRVGAGGAVVAMDRSDSARIAKAVTMIWYCISVVGKWAAGAYIFCRRDAWVEVGGFEEDLYVTEEIWFARKLKRWCRQRRLKFQIITKTPIVTSARKLQWFTPWQLVKQFAILSAPWAMRQRKNCDVWYTRPAKGKK